MAEKQRKYHGWILVEKQGNGLRDYVTVEWQDDNGRHHHTDRWYGESGCAKAVEWWDRKLNAHIQLQPTFRGAYRVYTEESLG